MSRAQGSLLSEIALGAENPQRVPEMTTEIMHMYDGNGRKAAELDVTYKSVAEVAAIIVLQELIGRHCVIEEDGLLFCYFRDENGDWKAEAVDEKPVPRL